MPDVPGIPTIPGGGLRQQRAAQLKAEMEAKQAAPQQEASSAVVDEAGFRRVEAGETLENIAAEYHASPEEIWEHPLNQELCERREFPEELEEGDKLYIPGQRQTETPPVGQGDYLVQEGDSMGSIARDQGYFWETIWNDPANTELKQVRENPNVLLPRDRVTIPPIHPKEETGETEMRHRFVRRGEPAALKLRVCIEDEPYGNEPYILVVDGDAENAFRGITDADGNIAIPIPGNARMGMLAVGPEDDPLIYELALGHIVPKQDVKGAQRRLHNLGLHAPDTGELDFETREALREFQRAGQLPVTGELDPATEERLRQAHGS